MYPSVSSDTAYKIIDKEGDRRYELANHLGNVLAVISDRKLGISNGNAPNYISFEAITISATDYYPFGMSMPGRSFTAANTEGYRYSFNGKEDDTEWAKQDFGARMYDKRLGRWLSLDPLQKKYPNLSSYSYCADNPILFIDPDGKDIVIAFTGGFQGGGKQQTLAESGTTGAIVNSAQQAAMQNGIKFNGAVFAPGFSVDDAVNNAFDFIKKNHTPGEKIIIYGYSYGGDAAVELSKKLKDAGLNVNLLVTVDAADGPLMGTTVDRDIPSNVFTNMNEFQTTNSVIGSRGDKNNKKDCTQCSTIILNMDVSKDNPDVDHGSIDEAMQGFNSSLINRVITGNKTNSQVTNPTNDKGSSRSSSEKSSGSSSGSSSRSSFEENKKSSSSGSSKSSSSAGSSSSSSSSSSSY